MGTMGPVSGQAITLANSIIGVGILAMPFCFKQCGIVLSIVILVGSGLMSRLACHFLLKSAIVSRRKNFEALAYQVFGSTGKFAVEIGIIGFLMGTCVAYFVVVGDLGPQIIAKMLNLNQSDTLRTGVMIVVSVVCVLPLGLLRNVDSLSNVCAATIGFYFCLVLKVIMEAEGPLFSGEWMNKVEYWEPSGVLQCLPIFSMALFCQTQLFEIYDTLPNATLDKMNSVTKNAVNICSAVYVLVGLFGYIAFCNQPISGNILLSFSPTLASDAIKMGFVMSLAFSFPLIIFPCRASLYSLLYRKGQASHHELLNNLIPEVRFKCLTVGIVGVALLVGLMLPNIELVLGLVGSTIGVMICVIFPATCFICVSSKNTNERLLAQLVLCFGIIIMVLGTYANLQAAEIDNISLENKIISETVHNKYMENKILKALSPDILENDILMEPAYVKVKEAVNVDSIIQPPNPVAPKEEKIENDKKIIVPVAKMDNIDHKESPIIPQIDTPSKDDKEGAGDSEVQLEVNAATSLPVKPNVALISQDPIKADKLPENQEKINLEKEEIQNENDDLKKQVLMDTIKRHAEEQRQMVIEQQKILEEIKETKKDIDIKQKSDVSLSIETKKQAVEEIKKMAKIAIESLGSFDDVTVLADKVSPPTDEKVTSNKMIEEKKQEHLSNIEETKVQSKLTFQKNTKMDKKIVTLNNVNEEIKKHNVVEEKKTEVLHNVKDKNMVLTLGAEKDKQKPIDQNINTNNVHVHKKDEPESYKIGEDIEHSKKFQTKDAITPERINNENIANRVPIVIAMSKTNNVTKQIEKQVEKIPTENPKLVPKHETKVVKNVPQDDYVGGKRDILEFHTAPPGNNDILSVNKVAKVHNRNKREIQNCPGAILSKNGESQICKVTDHKHDLKYPPKLSRTTHTDNDILKLSDKNLNPDKHMSMMNSGNIVDYHIRNLKSVVNATSSS